MSLMELIVLRKTDLPAAEFAPVRDTAPYRDSRLHSLRGRKTPRGRTYFATNPSGSIHLTGLNPSG